MPLIPLDPFTVLLSIHFGSTMWLSVHASGGVLSTGSLSKEGAHGVTCILDPGVEDNSQVIPIFETTPYPTPPGQFEQWVLNQFGPPAPPPSYSGNWVRINQGGEWAVQDIPGLPVSGINPTITTLYLYNASSKRDTSNLQSGLSDSTGLQANPIAHLTLPNSGIVVSPGQVEFTDVLVRITENSNFQVTILPP